jgi:hypothetical protein
MHRRASSNHLLDRFDYRGVWGREHWREIDTVLKFAAAAAVASMCPLPLLLPVLSMMLLAIGFWTAGGALLRGDPRQSATYTRWDESGLLVFAGFAAAIISDPMDAWRYFERFEMGR